MAPGLVRNFPLGGEGVYELVGGREVHGSRLPPPAPLGSLGEDPVERERVASGRWVGWGIHLTSVLICKEYKAAKTIEV